MKIPIKAYLKYFLLVLVLSMVTCESSYKEIIYFDTANFTVTEMQATDSTFFVKGLVKNDGNYSFKTPWYFTYEISALGGKTGQIFPGEYEMTTQLASGDSLEWEDDFEADFFRENASSAFHVNNFEAFHILE